MTNGERYVIQARTWLYTPFFHTGRQKGIGVDCVGLTLCVAQELGIIPWYMTPTYSPVMPNGFLRAEVERFCDPINNDDIESGDILLYKFGGLEQHTAIWTGEGTIIHAFQDINAVSEHEYSGIWIRQVTGIYRIKRELWPL